LTFTIERNFAVLHHGGHSKAGNGHCGFLRIGQRAEPRRLAHASDLFLTPLVAVVALVDAGGVAAASGCAKWLISANRSQRLLWFSGV
jgi:hypothetical protein